MTDKSLRNGGDTEFQMSVVKCEACEKAFLQQKSLAGHKGSCHE